VALQDQMEFVALQAKRLPVNLPLIRSTLLVQVEPVVVASQLHKQVALAVLRKSVQVEVAEVEAMADRLALATTALQVHLTVVAVAAVARQKERRPVLVAMAHLAIVS
jgi:hypothetical protein